MKKLTSVLFLIVGVIHLLPLVGVVGADKIAVLYGIQVEDPNLAILMRHRAVLFGLLGAFICYSAFRPAQQLVALIAGAVSVVSFLVLAWTAGGYNPQIDKVVTVDLVALVCLALAAVIHVIGKKQTDPSLAQGTHPG